VPGIGVPLSIANAISFADALRSVLSSPDVEASCPSGPVESLLELHATLAAGVTVLSRWGFVRETDERE
jgi:hypothetical protein